MNLTCDEAALVRKALKLAMVNSGELAEMASSCGDTDEFIRYKAQVIAYRRLLERVRGDK